MALMSNRINVGEISKAILALKSMPGRRKKKLGRMVKIYSLNHTYQVLGKVSSI